MSDGRAEAARADLSRPQAWPGVSPHGFADLTVARRQLLADFAADTRRRLGLDGSAVGQVLAEHVGRQLDLVASDPYADWFAAAGRAAGFDPAVVAAAIAGTDVTRASRFSAAARGRFGTTAGRVADLAAAGDLRYGRAFADVSGLEDLYMHAEAGRHYTRAELTRRASAVLPVGVAARMAAEVADAVVGHDSFNAGFGRHRLKPLLAARHGGPAESFDYPASQSPAGFLVQVLDRVEGLDPRTVVRYVTEGVSQRGEPITVAVRSAIVDQAAYLPEVFDQIARDARATLDAAALAALDTFPGLRALARHLDVLPRVAGLLGTPLADGFYHLRVGGRDVPLDGLAAVREHFLSAARAVTEA